MSFTPTDTVLVTGANGHVGQHVLAQLLALPPLSRPHVRAAVRNPSSAAPLEAAFAAALAAGALSLVYVPDIVAPDAYAAAVHACTHIAHLASPLVLAPRDLEADLDDFPTWVDVRDVARAHVAALLRSEASEEPARWILSAKGVTMGDLAGIVRAEFPGLGGSGEVDGLKEGEYFDIKREEAQKALGIEEWIGIEAMVRDTIAPILEHRRKNHAES
ncbi:hypothetical protein FH972_009496 [Carpinus fangiana]|uniref:NmrA-like domain-containing protein n=1 Tax=Carpinus fangiana TaxID=176857 RepID=A0A660KKI2_9ROSI|nr:hypothetical protein FH972_009496 [Carpinus fangiana]